MVYDVAVVGLGPAGSTLAKFLGPELRVIALDKKKAKADEGGFCKPCGGLLAPDAQKSLSRFHLTLPVDVLVDPQIFSVRTIDVATGLVRYYQRHYINLDRHKLDLWLKSLIPPWVEVHHDTRVSGIEHCTDGFRIRYREDGETFVVTARTIVGADGANSVVRNAFFPAKKLRTYLSIQQWFRDTHATPFYSCVFDPGSTDCYAWGLTKDDYFLFGGAFAVKDGREKFHELKDKLSPYGFQLDDPVRTEACLNLRPGGPGSFVTGAEGVFLVGEAAGFISPSSLEGISYAIDSGYLLSKCLRQDGRDANRLYHAATRKIRLKLLGKSIKSPFMHQPVLRRLVMMSGLSSITVLPEPYGGQMEII